MKRLKGPVFSLGASGRLTRALTLARRRGGPAWLRRGHPTNPNTPAQQEWRNMYQMAIALWHALSAAETREWEIAATLRHMTGYAWFMSQALRPNPGLYLPLLGGTMQGEIDMDDNHLGGLIDPTTPDKAARKAYVDTFTPQATFDTHEAATTGIHGVGASTIDSVAARNAAIAAAALGQAARVRNSADQQFTTGNYALVHFNVEDYDNDGMADLGVNDDRLTFQTEGLYLVIGAVQWEASPGGRRLIQLHHSVAGNIAVTELGIPDVSNVWRGQVIGTVYAVIGSLVRLYAYQTSGGDLDLDAAGYESPALQAIRIG